MKFDIKIVSIFLVLCTYTLSTSYANTVRINYMHGQKLSALTVKKIFNKKYLIPSRIIELRGANNCNLKKSSRLQSLELCINKKGELISLSQINSKIIHPLQIFSKDVL